NNTKKRNHTKVLNPLSALVNPLVETSNGEDLPPFIPPTMNPGMTSTSRSIITKNPLSFGGTLRLKKEKRTLKTRKRAR
ncbi:hypothetical protein EBV26_19930, partial [bacterium]|nr:hypothetical protein [bacterium]